MRIAFLVLVVLMALGFLGSFLPDLPLAPMVPATAVRQEAATSGQGVFAPASSSGSADAVAVSRQRAAMPPTDWGTVIPITIGGVAVEASVASTREERMAGLSGTKVLPPMLVKLFIFPSDGPQPIWMKDMNYPIDILWLDAAGTVVHIEPAVDPSTYPQSFASPVPARYVIETNAGFVAAQGIVIGATVSGLSRE